MFYMYYILCIILLGHCSVGKAQQTCSANNSECGDWCRACVEPGNCQSCIKGTTNQQYVPGSDGFCHECPQHCSSLSCQYSTTSQTATCYVCNPGYTAHEGNCYECPQNCNGYSCSYNTTSQTTDCRFCIAGYTEYEGSCYACQEGCLEFHCYYNDTTSTPGTQCGCPNDAIPDTTTDQDNQFRGVCLFVPFIITYACKEGYYYDDSSPGLPTCTACGIPGCAHCNATVAENITCIEPCPEGCNSCYYNDTASTPGIECGCRDFERPVPASIFENAHGNCSNGIDVCRVDYYYDITSAELPGCIACPPGCNHCYYNDTASTPGVECGCPGGEILDTVDYPSHFGNCGARDQVCMHGYTYDNHLPGLPRCTACPEGCNSCYYNDTASTPAIECGCRDLERPVPASIFENAHGNCSNGIDVCRVGYYYDITSAELPACTACPPGCYHCYYNDTASTPGVQCGCSDGEILDTVDYYSHSGNCGARDQVCMHGYTYDNHLPGLPRCTACPKGCQQCFYNATSSTPGIECGCFSIDPSSTTYNYRGNCGYFGFICDFGHLYVNSQTNLATCIACGTNCFVCELGSDQMPVCTNCLSGYFIADGKCQKCSSHCAECELCSGRCLVCEHLFNLNSFGECTGNSSITFESGNSSITFVSPLFGPLSGGTKVTVSGYNFITNYTAIFLDDIVTRRSSSNRTHVIVTTPKVNSTYQDQPLTVSGQINGMTLPTSFEFIYKGDPKIQKIYPLNTIREGGTTLTVEGDSLDSVSQPVLTITVVIKVIEIKGGVISVISEESQTYKENCKIANTSILLCPTPALDIPDDVKLSENRRRKRATAQIVQSILLEIKEQSMHQLRDLHLEETISFNIRKRRQADSGGRQKVANIYIGLIFDGVPDFRNVSDNEELKEYGQLKVNKRPTFEDEQRFTFEKGKPIGIVGTDVDKLRLSDYAVKIGLSDCHVENTIYNTLYCMPPQKKPSTNESQEEGTIEALEILVFIGSNVKEYIGTITYESPMNTMYIIIGVVVGISILAVVITTSILLVIRFKSSKTKNAKTPQINPNQPIHLPPVPVEESDIVPHMSSEVLALPIVGSSWPPQSGMGLKGPEGYSRRRNIPSMYPEDESSNGYLEPKRWAGGIDARFDQDTVTGAASNGGDHFDEFWEQADESDIMEYSRRVADVINNIDGSSLPDILHK